MMTEEAEVQESSAIRIDSEEMEEAISIESKASLQEKVSEDAMMEGLEGVMTALDDLQVIDSDVLAEDVKVAAGSEDRQDALQDSEAQGMIPAGEDSAGDNFR